MPNWTLDRWLAVLGCIGTVLGIIVSLWIWVRSRQEAVPRYKTQTLELMAPRNEKYYFSSTDVVLRVNYGSESSDRVSKVFVAVWNSGRRTLDAADSVGDHQYRITLPPSVMLWGDPRILTSSRPEIGLRTGLVPGSRSEVFVDFDFLDRGDGGLVEILCAGQPTEVQVKGTFKGSKSLRGRANLGLAVTVSPRERLLAILPQFVTGGKEGWYLWIEGSLISLLFLVSFSTNSVVSMLVIQAIALFLAVLVISSALAMTGPEPLSGSTRGVPRRICHIPYVADAPRSRADGEFRRFIEDLRLEVGRRRRKELRPWERGEPGIFGRALSRWKRWVGRRLG